MSAIGEDFDASKWRVRDGRRILFILPYTPLGSRIVKAKTGTENPAIVYPLGLAYVAGAARAAGHDPSILIVGDVKANEARIRAELRHRKPDVVGIACFVDNVEACTEAARMARAERPGAFVVVGGPQATVMPEHYLQSPHVDAAVVDEGEITFCALLKALGDEAAMEATPGLRFRAKDGRIVKTGPRPLIDDLDSIPPPAVDLYPFDFSYPAVFGLHDKKATVLLGSRGCPYPCTYCATQTVWGRSYRFHSPERVVAEMNALHERWGFEFFVFYDDILTVDRKHTLALCEAIVKHRRAEFGWSGATRVDRVDPELLEAMRRAGCYFLSYGIETGSERLLKHSKKGVTVEQNRRGIKLTREAGIKVGASFMLGFPTETREDTKATIRFAIETKPDLCYFSVTQPLMGTPMMAEAQAAGQWERKPRPGDLSWNGSFWIPEGRTREELWRWRRVAERISRKWMLAK